VTVTIKPSRSGLSLMKAQAHAFNHRIQTFRILLFLFGTCGVTSRLQAVEGPPPASSSSGRPAQVTLPPAMEVGARPAIPLELLSGLPKPESALLPNGGGLTPIELAPPRPADGKGSAREFVEQLKGNDAAFEVVLGQSRILSLKQDLTAGAGEPTIASGDPSIIEFLAVSPRQVRITGLRYGTTDLSIVTGSGEQVSFEVRVVADLTVLEAKLRSMFPDASLRLGQIRNNIVVEGEARSPLQITQIIRTVQTYLLTGSTKTTGSRGAQLPAEAFEASRANTGTNPQAGNEGPTPPPRTTGELAGTMDVQADLVRPQVINLLRVPTSQQVLLKVQVAELNRTALRHIGANFLGVDPATGAIVGTQVTGVNNAAAAIGHLSQNQVLSGKRMLGAAFLPTTPISGQNGTTVFGIFQNANFAFTLNALRNNGMLKVLAEPNLVAMSGHPASFLAGGEFPVPVPQVSAGGVAPTVTVQFKEFGVRLGFLPAVVDDNVIRLSVVPEVSQIDFTIAVTLVSGGSAVPGLNVRRAQTTVELREGQTLAIAGLLQVILDGSTTRIPGLGDLPILGPFFSNTTNDRTEKELVVLVTPYIVEGMNQEQVPLLPGDEIKEPNDLELFLLNRIESRTGKDFRSTTRWDDVFDLRHHLNLEKKYVQGPVGFSE